MWCPAQGVVGAPCRACGDVEPGEPACGDGESCPGGRRSVLQGLWGRRTEHTGLGGWGVQPRGWSEFPAGPAGMDNRAWRDGESCPGGGRSVLQGLWGRRTGHTGPWGWGDQPKGWSEFPVGPAGIDNRAHRPGGMGSPAHGVVGATCRARGDVERGAPAWGGRGAQPRGCSEPPAWPLGGHLLQRTGRTGSGGRGVQPRGCSEPPARPVGGQYLPRTGRTGLGGTGSPTQGVFGASGRTRGYSLLPLSSSRQVSRQYRGS